MFLPSRNINSKEWDWTLAQVISTYCKNGLIIGESKAIRGSLHLAVIAVTLIGMRCNYGAVHSRGQKNQTPAKGRVGLLQEQRNVFVLWKKRRRKGRRKDKNKVVLFVCFSRIWLYNHYNYLVARILFLHWSWEDAQKWYYLTQTPAHN